MRQPIWLFDAMSIPCLNQSHAPRSTHDLYLISPSRFCLTICRHFAHLLKKLLCMKLGVIDVQAMVWAFVAAWTPPNPHLSHTKPTMKLCSKRIMVPIVEVVILAVITQTGCFLLMKSTEWYQGGNGSTVQVGFITCSHAFCG